MLTFGGLAREIARRAGYAGRRLSALQRERVLRRAVAATPLPALAGAAAAPGFVEAAGHLIAELQRSLITPQRFAAAMRSWAAEDRRREPYARDVAAIYLAYARELERAPAGRRRAARLAGARRAAGGARAVGAGSGVLLRVRRPAPLERDAVETLARVVGAPVTVSLTYEAGRSALGARAEVVEELRPLADRVLELPALDDALRREPRAPRFTTSSATCSQPSPTRRGPAATRCACSRPAASAPRPS